MRSRLIQTAIVLYASIVTAQDTRTLILPSSGNSAFPACAVGCAVLQQAQTNCQPSADTQLNFENCFCQSPTLGGLYSTPDAICTPECPKSSDRAVLQTWYTSFCSQVGQGIDPLTVIQSSPSISSVLNSQTRASTVPGATTILVAPDAPARATSISTIEGGVVYSTFGAGLVTLHSSAVEVSFTPSTESKIFFTTLPNGDVQTQTSVVVVNAPLTDEGGAAGTTGLKVSVTRSTTTASSAASSASASEDDSKKGPRTLSLGAKIGIGVAIPCLVVSATLIAIYCFRRRRRRRAHQEQDVDTSFSSDRKPELYAGPVDTFISGPIQRKPELPTSSARPLPPELHDTTIAEADPNAWKPKKKNTRRKPVVAASIGSSQGGSERPLAPIDSYTDSSLHATTTQSTEAELIEEADAAVQELGLLAMRKKTLVTQANTLGKKPEEVEGRKGEEYRELVVREEKVRKRLDDIEAERGG